LFTQISLKRLDKLEAKKQSPFEIIASSKGYSPRKKNSSDELCKDVSHILTAKSKDGKPISIKVDVKKNKNKKQFEDWIWIEFKNSRGKAGWIHGDSHFVVFERSEDFLFINRKELLAWVNGSKKIRYDLPFVNLAKKAKYRIYQREGKREEISQVNVKDLQELKSYQLWKKQDAPST